MGWVEYIRTQVIIKTKKLPVRTALLPRNRSETLILTCFASNSYLSCKSKKPVSNRTELLKIKKKKENGDLVEVDFSL
jgi:hypothetical protein